MKNKNYKRKCTRITLSKCESVCSTYNDLQLQCAYYLQNNPDIKSYKCNVFLEGVEEGEYTSDFVCKKINGEILVVECVYVKNILRPSTIKLLDLSYQYWARRGALWSICVNKEEKNNDSKK